MRRGLVRGALAPLLAAALAGPLAPTVGAAASAPTGATATANAASTAWRQQFDDPVLTSLLAVLPAADNERAFALARQWVAVRVLHAQWSALQALSQMAQGQQVALMDLPPGSAEREARLTRVAAQIEQLRGLATARAARRDEAIDAVARLAGATPQLLVSRIGEPLSEWRLPHLVAEPPTVRLTVSPGTSGLAQRLSDLHACHQAALQADRAALDARQRLAQAGEATAAPARQALLLALSAQAAAAGDLALAWLDYLAVAPAATASTQGAGHAGHTGTRASAGPV